MPYANDFIKVDIIGDAYEQNEIWNTGLKLKFDDVIGGITREVLEAAASQVANAWETFFTSSFGQLNSFSNKYRTTEVKAAHVGTNGKYIGDSVSVFYDTALVGKGSGTTPAPQTAIVGTFGSNKQRGAGSKGRMYLPGITYVIQNNGLMSQNRTEEISDRFNAFVNNINANDGAISYDFTVILASPVGGGIELPVTATGVDSKVDTQRRRANALKGESYQREVLYVVP